MRHFVKVLEDWSNWTGLNDALHLPLGSVAHFVESMGRVLQEGCVIGCLPLWSLQLFPFWFPHKVEMDCFLFLPPSYLILNVLFVFMSILCTQKHVNNFRYIVSTSNLVYG